MLTINKPNIIPASTVLNTTVNSLAMQLENMIGYAIQVVYTGTPTGAFKLQASCDPVPQPSLSFGANGVVTYAPTNWSDIANSSQSITAAGSYLWDMSEIFYNYVRVVYTDSSGGASTAIVTVCTFNSKGI